MSLTNQAVSLVARHKPVVAERLRTSRVTRTTVWTWPAHSVSAKQSQGDLCTRVELGARLLRRARRQARMPARDLGIPGAVAEPARPVAPAPRPGVLQR